MHSDVKNDEMSPSAHLRALRHQPSFHARPSAPAHRVNGLPAKALYPGPFRRPNFMGIFLHFRIDCRTDPRGLTVDGNKFLPRLDPGCRMCSVTMDKPLTNNTIDHAFSPAFLHSSLGDLTCRRLTETSVEFLVQTTSSAPAEVHSCQISLVPAAQPWIHHFPPTC
ncbi:hypothetical protein BGZ61DRAFT_446885 [Ilyonectria robusta]|uniref:uncharacterized protein n=1 Tax=Ilyonectria robusta TaxID=1079257 RepID=UPI001E8D38F5|nr:uncharacterized protein BGZ61DRAFT_446885 [Ilyonectria robusta]KAH8729717.1 hypothetical protein BGZ61DRAFT_446885 [Ilyonectria robusta]